MLYKREESELKLFYFLWILNFKVLTLRTKHKPKILGTTLLKKILTQVVCKPT